VIDGVAPTPGHRVTSCDASLTHDDGRLMMTYLAPIHADVVAPSSSQLNEKRPVVDVLHPESRPG